MFPFRDRKALVSVDSNCSRHMTGLYDLVDVKPCDISVNGAFKQVSQGNATHSGLLQLGQLFFEDAVHVERNDDFVGTIGCSRLFYKDNAREMEVYLPSNQFLFSAFLHARRYFLNTEFYCGHAFKKQEDSMTIGRCSCR